MSEQPLTSIEECLGDIHDPRVQGRCDYPLMEISVIAICAVVAGADNWVEVETFGKSRLWPNFRESDWARVDGDWNWVMREADIIGVALCL